MTAPVLAPGPVVRRLALLQKYPALAALSAELGEVGSRLGTGAERPGDEDEAQALGHKLRNMVCACSLLAELSSDELDPSASSECQHQLEQMMKSVGAKEP